MGVTQSDLNLGTLTNNGGYTKTMIPLSNSIAIDNGNIVSGVNRSQNGPVVGGRDIGAAESGVKVFNDTICNGTVSGLSGRVFSTPGRHFDSIINGVGQVTNINEYNLVFLNTKSSISDTICSGFVTLPSGKTVSLTGTYFDTISNSQGCDSIIEFSLFNKNDYSVFYDQGSLHSNETNAIFQWLDCDSGFAPILGEINSSFVVPSEGSYAVEILKNGCLDTSVCTFVSFSCFAKFTPTQTVLGEVVLLDSTMGSNLKYTWYFGDGDSSEAYLPTHTYYASGKYQVCLKIQDTVSFCSDYFCDSIEVDTNGVLRNGFVISVIRTIEEPKIIPEFDEITVYPNPFQESFFLNVGEDAKVERISVVNINGQLIKEITPDNSGQYEINLEGKRGVYFLRIIRENESKTLKIIKY